jgi:conjugal transfer pilus assembly protein TraW
MRVFKLHFLLLILIFSNPAFSNFDVIGKTFQIEEVSLLDEIMNRLKEQEANGEFKKLQERMKNKAIANIENPRGRDYQFASESRIRYFDPSIVTNENIYLPDGQLLHLKGTRVNPLAIRPLTKKFIFIDGRSDEQVEWAVKTHKDSGYRDKIILTNGAFGELTRKHKIRFYFDQNVSNNSLNRKTLASEFGVEKLPTIVHQKYQADNFLTIEEVAL